MLDPWFIRHIKNPLSAIAEIAKNKNITPNQITIMGFLIGICVIPLLAYQHYGISLIIILINRIFDGLDGALARKTGITDAGGFLDISLDFLFYSAVPFGFALAQPEHAIAATFLIFSFVGTGSSFLAFSSIASKRSIPDPVYKNKSLYYITGLTEGAETIICFVLFCLFPSYFPILASVFAILCFITTLTRIYNGFQLLK